MILDNLRRYPEDECYQIKDKIYKNKDLYKYACNIYQYLLERCSYQDLIVVCGHKEIYMIASFLACSFAGMTYVPIDVSTPKGRRERIITQINPGLIIDNSIQDVMDKESFKEISDIQLNLAFIELINELEERYDIEIQPTQVPGNSWNSIDNIIELVSGLRSG